jgi:DNA replication protein DnaC
MMIGSTEQMTCPTHGTVYTSTVTKKNKLGMIFREGCCPDCEADRETKWLAERAEEAKLDFQRRLDTAKIQPRFLRKTFEDYNATTDGQKKALKIAREYAENFGEHLKAGRCLIFSGRVGCGKTHLACAIIHSIIARPFAGGVDGEWTKRRSDDWHTCRYVSASGIIRDIRDSWGDREMTETRVFKKYTSPSLLVVDEIGRQNGDDRDRNLLDELIDLRYEAMKPTLISTNCDKLQMANFIGERGLNRLFENDGILCLFNWGSHRGGQ